MSERTLCGVNNVCQSQRNEECQTRDINTCRESACVCKKLLWISRILIPVYLICIVTVFSFKTILKDHALILSTYNRAADLNKKYLREINDSKRVITSLEQKISKVEEERDLLQLATRLIAPDKYEHFSDAKRPSTKPNMQITNGSSYNCASQYPLPNDWQNIPISNLANFSASKRKKSSGSSSLCIGNIFDVFMDESDKIRSEQKQENTVITISQSPPLSHDQTKSVCIIESPLPIYGNTTQNTDYIHNTHASRSLQGENHNQLDVHLPSGHSQQSREGEILDRPNVSSEEPQFSQQSISDHNADCQRAGQSTHQSVVLIGDSIIKGIVSYKLTRIKVHKFTYPGRLVEEIDQEIRKSSNTEAAHVIIHCGTNNSTTNSANECVNKIK